MKVANFLILGNKRCGSSWLNRNLKEHPDIYMTSNKGFHFFDRDFDRGLEFYQKYFEQANQEKIRGETEHSYFWHDEVPSRIKKTLGDIPMMITFRHPVDRAYSHFQILNREGAKKGPLPEDFEKAFYQCLEQRHPVADWGFYGKRMELFLRFFPLKNFHFVLYENILAYPEKTIQEAYRFLGVDPNFICPAYIRQRWTPATNVPEGVGKFAAYLFYTSPAAHFSRRVLKKIGFKNMKLYRKFSPQPLNPDLKKKLTSVYEEDIRLLMDLTGMDLHSWLL